MPQRKVLSRVKLGQAVKVIYDPAKPEAAYIGSPGLRYAGYLYLLVGLIMATVALAGLFAGR